MFVSHFRPKSPFSFRVAQKFRKILLSRKQKKDSIVERSKLPYANFNTRTLQF